MAEFDIGNGKVIEIPDDLSGADRDELAAIVQRQYGVDINKTTILGQAEATLKGIPRGAAKGLMGLVEAPARLFDIGNDSEFVQGLSQFKDYLDTESVLAADPEYRDTWMTQLGEGFGSTVPFLGAGKVGSLLAARGVGGRGLLDPRFLAGVPLAASMGQVEASENVDASRALGEDVSPLQEIIAELGGPIIGLSEMLPIFNLFKRVPKNALKYSDIRRKIQSAAAAFGEEGLQEVSASLAQDLLARGLYSDELPIGDSIFDEFTIGGSVGAIADLAVNAMSGRSRGREYLRDREKQARKNQVTLEVENKFERGQKQGTLEEVTDDIPIEEKPLVPIPAKIINPPILEVIQNTDNTFSVIDLNNKESEFGVGTILKTFDNESKAFVFKNKQETNHERKKLAVELKNITYNLGMPESASAHRLGATILDPNISSINLQTLINFDSKLSSEQKKIFNQQKNKVIGPNPYQEMLANKAKHLEAITKYMKQKGFNLQATYTMPQVKKILSKKDFDSFSKDLSNVIHSESVKNKEPSILVDKEKFNVNLKYIKDLAASKNIDIDFKDPAVRYAALQWTGVEDITKANRGTKELFLTRLHSLPKFNSKTKFPDFRPRKYTAKDMADFVASKGSENIEFSVKDLLKNGVTAKDKASTERFINDLIISGRAKKVEGKNKYKINKNFEYDIARRAEGFNETPEEFGDRLRQEGKLPEEAILKLIEDEKIKQRKVLPPQEIDKKVINYKEAVEEGRVNKFAKELNKILSKMGLTETGLVVSNDILSTTNLVENAEGKIVFDPRGTRATEEGVVEGEYDKNTDIIFLSLDAVNPDGTATDEEILSRLTRILDHESIHALREKDLINEKEYQYLREEVKRKKVPSTFDGQYKGKTFYQRAVIQNQGREDLDTVTVERKEELYVEEAIAEMYRSRNHSPDLSPKSTGILNKIARFFKSMGQAMRLSGFQKTSDIFAEIEQGKIGSRDRGEIRTLRELDRLSPSLIDMPIAEPTEGETPVNEPTDVVTIGESGGIATPVTTFEDVESDIDPITGVLISPSGFGRAGSSIFNFRKQTKEQLEAQRVAMIQEFGYGHVKSEDVLTWLSKNAPSKDYKVIADRLLTQVKKLRKMKKIDFQFRIIIEGTDRLPIPGHTGERLNWHGVSYAPFSYEGGIRQQVYIADRGRPRGKTRAKVDGVNLETVLHELVHQATQAATYDFNIDAKTKENLAELEKIRKRVREEINARKRAGENIDNYVQYGTKNVQELLAVGFTDREFQKFMESIPYSPRGKKSLWDKFTETLRKLLNIPAKQGTAFSEFLLQAGRITNLSQKQIAPLLGGREMSGRVNFGPPVADYEIRKRFTPEQQKILDRIERIDIELMQITSELKDSMGSNTYNRIMSKRDSLIAERSDLNEKLNTLPEPPINPNIESQIPLFSRTRTPTQSAADQYNITKLQKNALYTNNPIDVSAVRSRLNKYTDEQLFEIGADAQRTSIEGMFSNYDKAVGYLSTSMPIGDLYGASMGFGTNGNIMAIKPIARLAEKLRKPSVTDTYNHPPDIKIYQRKFSEMTAEQKAVASRYAEASRKLPTFNEVQWMARQFNIALGELNLPLLTRMSNYFQDASLPNNIKNVIDKSTKIDPYYIEIPDIEYFDNIVKELYKNSASGNFSNTDIPMFSRGTRFADDRNNNENIKLKEAVDKATESVKQTPRGQIPYYSMNASDVALRAALDFNEDTSANPAPKDIPNYSRGAIPEDLRSDIIETGYDSSKTKSIGATFLDVISNPIESSRALFRNFRENIVDKLDKVERRLLEGSEENEEVRLANLSADTGTMASMRMADKARGIFQAMLMKGSVQFQIEGQEALTSVNSNFKIDTVHNPFIEGNTSTGGLMQIMSPLYADPTVDLESVFALYAKVKRVKTMQDNGIVIDSPVSAKNIEQLKLIETKYKSVVEVYNNYQKWNNELIKFARAKGLLNEEQAALWLEHSSYYPFYRDMVDEVGLAAPTIGGGSLPSNPLNIKMKGSEREIKVNPVEAIARNSLSILTGAMKNDGTSKLLRDLKSLGEARIVGPKTKQGLNTIFVFEDGNKVHYEIDDVELFHGVQAIGGVKTDAITKFLAFPSAILRDTVTRDPGFVIVNLLRDTLSAAVTSGAPMGGDGFTPVVDTVKNMFADMENLEKFGVIGGYDFQNDEGSVKQLMDRARRQQGLSPDNGLSAKNSFFKLWDGLGALTTKSDGATRLAVYNAVYNDMKKKGANEAQAQSEAAYQALEIINFGRRGLSPTFRIITAAIPFFNARIQGLDVLYRSATGKYSSVDKLNEGETLKEFQNKVQRKFALRGSMMMATTLLYYLLVSDTEEYEAVSREVRDDNWIIPMPFGLPAIKIPIPFEVGMLFKAVPERLIDMAMGEDAVEKSPGTSIYRQLGTSAQLPFVSGDIGIQALKPFFEAIINRNSFTGGEIVPYYKEKELPAYQARQSSNEVARLLGEALNISPMKIEHVLSGYTGTLGGYVLDIMDVFSRSVTGTPIMPPRLNDIPVLKRLLIDIDKAGGLQQSFYELRTEVNRATATLNDLKKQKRWDEVAAYKANTKGTFEVKGQVRAIERYMKNWREKRDRLLRRTDVSPLVKSDMIRDMEIDRDKRLAIVPSLRQKADVNFFSFGN